MQVRCIIVGIMLREMSLSEYAMMGGEEGLEECVGLQRIHRICIMSTIPYHSHTTTIPYHSHITTIPYHSQFPYSNHTIPFPHKQCYAYDSVPALPHSDHTLYLVPLIFPRHVYHNDVVVWDGESVGKQNKLGLRLSTMQRFCYHLGVC